jgi:hypothetical protein
MTKTVIKIRKGAKIFIIEDNEERLNWFSEQIPHATIWTEKDPNAAVAQFEMMPPDMFDCIFLDFDLGPGNVNSTVNALPVVNFLSRMSRRSQRNIVIHSQNNLGAFMMNTMLPGATQLPFGTFDIQEIHA